MISNFLQKLFNKANPEKKAKNIVSAKGYLTKKALNDIPKPILDLADKLTTVSSGGSSSGAA